MRRGSRERREGDGLAPSKGSNALLCICMPPAACRRWVRAVFDNQHGSAWEGRRGLLVLRLQAKGERDIAPTRYAGDWVFFLSGLEKAGTGGGGSGRGGEDRAL
jgi:hypothetical protein